MTAWNPRFLMYFIFLSIPNKLPPKKCLPSFTKRGTDAERSEINCECVDVLCCVVLHCIVFIVHFSNQILRIYQAVHGRQASGTNMELNKKKNCESHQKVACQFRNIIRNDELKENGVLKNWKWKFTWKFGGISCR